MALRGDERYVAQNRRARHDYLIEDTIEAGLMLVGTEVKVLRQGLASINEAYATEKDGDIYLVNSHFPEYPAARFNHEPRRPRKLLLPSITVMQLPPLMLARISAWRKCWGRARIKSQWPPRSPNCPRLRARQFNRGR